MAFDSYVENPKDAKVEVSYISVAKKESGVSYCLAI